MREGLAGVQDVDRDEILPRELRVLPAQVLDAQRVDVAHAGRGRNLEGVVERSDLETLAPQVARRDRLPAQEILGPRGRPEHSRGALAQALSHLPDHAPVSSISDSPVSNTPAGARPDVPDVRPRTRDVPLRIRRPALFDPAERPILFARVTLGAFVRSPRRLTCDWHPDCLVRPAPARAQSGGEDGC